MGLGNLVQKAVYLGIGVASYAGEKAGASLNDLRDQMQKMADEMVERGEMTAEEAKKFVDETVRKAQQPTQASSQSEPAPPRSIEITDDEPETSTASSTQSSATFSPPQSTAGQSSGNTVNINPQPVQSGDDIDVDAMRKQVQDLQDELRRLRRE